jgi:hypothetical protein
MNRIAIEGDRVTPFAKASASQERLAPHATRVRRQRSAPEDGRENEADQDQAKDRGNNVADEHLDLEAGDP